MSKTFLISLDWDALRKHLNQEHNRELSLDEIQSWLVDAGFKPQGDHWLVKEQDLGVLDPSEVLTAEEVPDEKSHKD
jgi:hypothetical protein